MAITRREFLKISGITTAGLIFGVFDLKPIEAYAAMNPPKWIRESISVCGYCSVGCSMIVGTSTNLEGYIGKEYVVYVQGNPDSPINKGSLCSKGQSSVQLSTIVDSSTGKIIPNPRRLTQPLYRAPASSAWSTVDWTNAITSIKNKVKSIRSDENYFKQNEDGITVNRCEGIACLGGSSLNNEAAYAISKLMRALGVTYIETQARN